MTTGTGAAVCASCLASQTHGKDTVTARIDRFEALALERVLNRLTRSGVPIAVGDFPGNDYGGTERC